MRLVPPLNSSSKLGLDAVNISFLPKPDGTGKNETPLVITPRWENSLAFLEAWLEHNRRWLDEMLLQYGALLVRGFDIKGPEDLEAAIKAYQPCLNNTYRGTSPRKKLGQTEFIFSAAEVPTNYPIAQHLEMSFLPEPPKQLYFGCLQPSKSSGGETSLADFRRVLKDIPLDLKQKLLGKGIRYTRTHRKVGARFTYDVSDMLGWPELFGTDDKAQVEAICKAEGINMQWHGDTFVSTTQSSAFQLHPVTHEHVWFNHTQVFHWTTFPAELWYAFRRTHEIRLFLHFLLVGIFCVIKYGLLGHKMSLNSTFGDGEPISVKEMGQIRSAIHKNLVFSRWEKGDLLMIDNFSTSHGRQPTYDKGRKIAVAWSDPIKKMDDVVSLEPIKRPVSPVGSVCIENPQEKTPESTLTRHESAALQQQVLCGEELEAKLRGFRASENPQELALPSLFEKNCGHHRSFTTAF
jgi:alpha-ketoglutarate-dependent taurine dioxygenase